MVSLLLAAVFAPSKWYLILGREGEATDASYAGFAFRYIVVADISRVGFQQ